MIRRLGGIALMPLLIAAASVTMAGPVAAESRSVAITTEHGIRLKLNLPAGRWHADERIEGFVRVTNTNDRKAWFLDTRCRDVGVEVRVPTSPDQGRDWSGDRAAFKRLVLSTKPDLGPVVGRFTVEGVGDCAEPVPHSLAAGESRGYHVSTRVRRVGLGVSSLAVSAIFAFEGFRKSDAKWQDLVPAPISATLRVPLERRDATILTPAQAIDIALGRSWVRNNIVASDRSTWLRADMELWYRPDRPGRWKWRVALWADVDDPDDQARIVASFVVNARTGAVTTD